MRSKVQEMSDEYHTITGDIDALLARIAQQTVTATQVRAERGLTGMDSQKTLARLGAAQTALLECRSNVAISHAAAAKVGEEMGLPWECPDTSADAKPDLQVVNG